MDNALALGILSTLLTGIILGMVNSMRGSNIKLTDVVIKQGNDLVRLEGQVGVADRKADLAHQRIDKINERILTKDDLEAHKVRMHPEFAK